MTRKRKSLFKGHVSQSLREAIFRSAFTRVCSTSRTSLGLSAWLLFKAGQYSDILKLNFKPSNYTDAMSYYLDARIISMVKKSNFLPMEYSVIEDTYQKWFDAEELCKRTNSAIRDLCDNKPHGFTHEALDALFGAQRKIHDWLGKFPSHELVEVCRHGPGMDLGTENNNRTDAYFKYATGGHSTPGASRLASEYLWDTRISSWAESCELVSFNRLTMVPKTFTSKRTIAIEPRLNQFFQLGLGTLVEKRLRQRANIDIKHQWRLNEYLASTAYSSGYATIDLSMASDTICKNLVLALLPDEWFDPMALARSPFTKVKGNLHANEKFSSMGNGYTFPLETLIFHALATYVVESSNDNRIVSTFGDDIVIPADHAPKLISILSELGFVVNNDKSFTDGYFFESCGKDFFKDILVRPFFCKDLTSANDLVNLYNSFIHWPLGPRVDGDREFAEVVLLPLLRCLRLPRGPVGCPGVLWDDTVKCPPYDTHWEGLRVQALTFRPLKYRAKNLEAWLAKKLSLPGIGDGTVPLRGKGRWEIRDMVYHAAQP